MLSAGSAVSCEKALNDETINAAISIIRPAVIESVSFELLDVYKFVGLE